MQNLQLKGQMEEKSEKKKKKKEKRKREMGHGKTPKNRKNHHPYLWSDSKDEDPMAEIPPMFL